MAWPLEACVGLSLGLRGLGLGALGLGDLKGLGVGLGGLGLGFGSLGLGPRGLCVLAWEAWDAFVLAWEA